MSAVPYAFDASVKLVSSGILEVVLLSEMLRRESALFI